MIFVGAGFKPAPKVFMLLQLKFDIYGYLIYNVCKFFNLKNKKTSRSERRNIMICQKICATQFQADLLAEAIKSKREWRGVVRLIKDPFKAIPEILAAHQLREWKVGWVLEFELLDELPVGPGEEDYAQLANAYGNVIRELGISRLL